MPKLNLTIDELELIQERRKRNAIFNEGVEAALEAFTAWHERLEETIFDGIHHSIKSARRE